MPQFRHTLNLVDVMNARETDQTGSGSEVRHKSPEHRPPFADELAATNRGDGL
jgi:hypothetical protein